MSQSRFQIGQDINKAIVYIQTGEKHFLNKASDFNRVLQKAVVDI